MPRARVSFDMVEANPGSSCPDLFRASTSFRDTEDVDGRDEPGHDSVVGHCKRKIKPAEFP